MNAHPDHCSRTHVLFIGAGSFMHRRVQGLPNVDTALLFVEGSRASGGHVLTQAIPRAESDSAEAWVRAAAEVDRSWPVHRVAAFTDRHIGFASVIAQRLNVPYHDPATVAAVNDKLVMRERLIRAGVDLTPAAVAEGIAELANFGRQHGYPMILKPAGGTASSGIAQINEAGDIPGAFRKVCAAWPTGRLLVEAWLPGEEFSVECFSSRGIHKIVGLTRKFKDQITFVETGHQIPAGLSKTDAERLAVFVCRCLTALGVRDGPTHSEVMIHGDDIHLIETHLRMGGDYIPELLATSYGVDLPALTAQWIVCGPVEPALLASLPDEAEMHSVIRYLSAEKHGVIEAFEGVDEALLQPGVLAVEVFFTPGDQVRPAEQSGDRLAAVRTCAYSAELAHERARDALNFLRVSYSGSLHRNQASPSSTSSSDTPSAIEETSRAT